MTPEQHGHSRFDYWPYIGKMPFGESRGVEPSFVMTDEEAEQFAKHKWFLGLSNNYCTFFESMDGEQTLAYLDRDSAYRAWCKANPEKLLAIYRQRPESEIEAAIRYVEPEDSYTVIRT